VDDSVSEGEGNLLARIAERRRRVITEKGNKKNEADKKKGL